MKGVSAKKKNISINYEDNLVYGSIENNNPFPPDDRNRGQCHYSQDKTMLSRRLTIWALSRDMTVQTAIMNAIIIPWAET